MKRIMRSGFTIIELLLVISIIGVLSTTMVLIINPGKQLAKARDSQRESDTYSIASVVQQYAAEHSGTLPDTDGNPLTNNFPTTLTCIGTSAPCFNLAASGDGTVSLVPDYVVSIPKDPKPVTAGQGTDANTGYKIMVDSHNHVTVSATGETKTISVTK